MNRETLLQARLLSVTLYAVIFSLASVQVQSGLRWFLACLQASSTVLLTLLLPLRRRAVETDMPALSEMANLVRNLVRKSKIFTDLRRRIPAQSTSKLSNMACLSTVSGCYSQAAALSQWEKMAQGHFPDRLRCRLRCGPCPAALRAPVVAPRPLGPTSNRGPSIRRGVHLLRAGKFGRSLLRIQGKHFRARQLKVVSIGAVAPVMDAFLARLCCSRLLRRSPASVHHGRRQW